MKLKLEAIDGSREQIAEALSSAAVKWLKKQDGYGEASCWVMATFDTYLVLRVYGEGASRHMAADYALTKNDDGTASVEFSNLRQVAVQTKVTEIGQGSADSPDSVTVVMEGGETPPGAAGLKTESYSFSPEIVDLKTESGWELWTRPTKLEAVRGANGSATRVRGSAPLGIVGAQTRSKTVYKREAWKRLVPELQALLESDADAWREDGPWPVGAMYLSHGDRLRMEQGFNNLGDIAAKITRVYIGGGKSVDDMVDGDTVYIDFESVSTPKGQALAALLTETKFIKGISLAGFTRHSKVESDGIDYVTEMRAETGFGADFCDRPNMPYRTPSQAAPKLESGAEGGKGKKMTLKELIEKLKTESPESAGLIEALAADAESAKDLLKRVRVAELESAKGVITESYKDRVAKLEGLHDVAKGMVLEAVSAAVDTESARFASERPDLEPKTESFRDLVVSAVDKVLEKEREKMQKLVAESLKAGLSQAGIPAGAVPAADPGGEPKFEAVPMINTLPYETLVVESDNERVGLPRGTKEPKSGKPYAPRMTDVILSEVLGGPVYMEHPRTGGLAHVLDVFRPGLRAKVAQMSEIYSDFRGEGGRVVRGAPFVVDASEKGFNDSDLRKMESYQKFNAMVRGELKMEANEVIATDLGTLHPDIRQGVLEYLFAKAIFPQIATLVPCKSTTYHIYYKDYRRTGEHVFGTLAQGGSWTTSADEGEVTYPGDAFLKVTTAITGTAVFTINYTNENSEAKSTTLTVTAAAGTLSSFHKIYPEVGDRIKDITSISASGWSAGAVTGLAFDEPNAGSELAASGRAKISMETRTGTVEELSIETEISWRAMEDANFSLLNHGPGRVDMAAELVKSVGDDFMDYVDRRGVSLLNDSSDFLSSNTRGFDITTVPSDYTLPEWKKQLFEELSTLKAMLQHRSHLAPNWLLVNIGDEPKFTWFSDKLNAIGAPVDAFLQRAAWPAIAGMAPMVSENQNHRRFLAGSRETVFYPVYIPLQVRGPLYNGQKADVYHIRQRSAQLTVRPESRGYLSVTE